MSNTLTFGIDSKRLDADIRNLRAQLADLDERAVPKALAQALSRTADRTKTQTVREVAAVKQVPAKLLRNRIKAYRASPKTLKAAVWIGTKKHIPIESIPGAGIAVIGKFKGQLKAGKLAVKAFPATMRNGRHGLYVRRLPSVRRSRGRPATSSPNLPIEHPVVRLNPEAETILHKHAADQAAKFLPAEMRRLFLFHIVKLSKGV